MAVRGGTAEEGRRGFRPDVEGLRAIAILLVVLYHDKVPLISGGYVGVDVFFVISGFLITGQLSRELTSRGRLSFAGFYARRARRILPAATLVIIATVIASAVILPPLEAHRTFGDATACVFFVCNFRYAAQGANYFNATLPPSPLQHFWSLSVEEQFYVVWPLLLVATSLVWFARRRAGQASGADDSSGDGGTVARRRPVLPAVFGALVVLAVLSFLADIWQTPNSPSWAYYSIVTRAWELAVGALLALALPYLARLDRRLAAAVTWLGLGCIGAAAVMFSSSTPYPGDAAMLPVVGAAAIIAGGCVAKPRFSAETLLGTPPFQRLGSWSYSWYLWHWPFLILVPAALGHALSVPEALAVSAVSLAVAVASFVLVERPIRRMQFVVKRPAMGLAGAAGLAITSVTAIVITTAAMPSLAGTGASTRLTLAQVGKLTPAELKADLVAGLRTRQVPKNLNPSLADASSSYPIIVKNGCNLQNPETKSKPCIYGDTSSHTSMVLFGDSHGAAWFPALQLISLKEHWRLVDLTKAGCPPVEVNIVFRVGNQPYPQCTEWRQNSMNYIARLHPAIVIVTWARFLEYSEAHALKGVPDTYPTAWQNGTAAVFSFLKAHADHVIFLSDTPTQSGLAPDCVSAHQNDVEVCTTPVSRAVLLPSVKQQEKAIAAQVKVDYVDPQSWFCTVQRCPVIVGNIFMYRDNAHMTPPWSQFIAPVVADTIVPLTS